MKQLNLIATFAFLTISISVMSSTAHALDADMVMENFNRVLSNERALAQREVLKGNNITRAKQPIFNVYVNSRNTLKVELQLAGAASNKEVYGRLVVSLNSEHGGIILDVNQILFPEGRLAFKTATNYIKGEPNRTTTLYVPVAFDSLSATRERLVTLIDVINNGELGTRHARNRVISH